MSDWTSLSVRREIWEKIKEKAKEKGKKPTVFANEILRGAVCYADGC